jgi:hypothetical protein
MDELTPVLNFVQPNSIAVLHPALQSLFASNSVLNVGRFALRAYRQVHFLHLNTRVSGMGIFLYKAIFFLQKNLL